MYLQSLSSAFPEARYTQAECWEILIARSALDGLTRRSAKIMETVLHGASGIETRHFAIPPEQLFSADAESLNKSFEQTAPPLAARALRKACEAGSAAPEAIDAVFVCTCTGFLCPGVSSHLAEQVGLRPDAHLNDLSGLGCGAAIPALHAADCFLAAHPDALVAVVAVEVCSAAFFLDNDAGVLISACLFGDGASASLWRGRGDAGQWRAGAFQSLHRPEEREKIRFVNSGGRLRNQLHRAVPDIAASSVAELFSKRTRDPDQIIAHTGGRDVIEAIERRLPQFRLDETRRSLSRYGNLSSPSVLCSLEDRLQQNTEDTQLWITSFGAGFAAHACELTRE